MVPPKSRNEKVDPYKHKEQYLAWKERVIQNGIPEVSKYNSDITKQYVFDMENGINTSRKNKKGARSYIRLRTLYGKMLFFSTRFKELYGIDKITDITEEQLCEFFTKMRKGEVKRTDGKTYKSTSYYVKTFRAFWNWYTKIKRKEYLKLSDEERRKADRRDYIIEDITVDIESRPDKPEWVYLTEEQVRLLCDNAKYDYKVLMTFLYDSGIRSPTELVNIKVFDLDASCEQLEIRDETSKTFGRKIKLLLSSKLLKEYIQRKELGPDDYLFPITPFVTNKYIKRLAQRILGDETTKAGQKYSQLTMYDFRHCSACYWLPRYKTESGMKYRFGWKRSEMIHYYTEFLGMKDTISEEDLLVDVTKTEIEKRLLKTEKENVLMKEKMTNMEKQLGKILELVDKAMSKVL